MKKLQNNSKKLSKRELKSIQGGYAPFGCMKWNPVAQCCKLWDFEHSQNFTCPE